MLLVPAEVVELADAPDSKSGGSDIVWVRVPPSAPKATVYGCFFYLFFATFRAVL